MCKEPLRAQQAPPPVKLKPPHRPARFHVFCSAHNLGALELIAEVCNAYELEYLVKSADGDEFALTDGSAATASGNSRGRRRFWSERSFAERTMNANGITSQPAGLQITRAFRPAARRAAPVA